MTAKELNTIANAIELALEEVGKKHNVQIKRGNGTYSESSATLKLEIAEINEHGFALDQYAEAFLQSAHFLGFDDEDLFKTFLSKGETYRLVGLNPRSTKMPIIAVRESNGKRYQFNGERVAEVMGKTCAP